MPRAWVRREDGRDGGGAARGGDERRRRRAGAEWIVGCFRMEEPVQERELPPEDDEEEDDDARDEEAGNRAYERAYEDAHSWEALEEDEHGRLTAGGASAAADAARARRRRALDAAAAARVRRGMIRYLELVVDLSRAASATDMRPSRAAAVCAAAAAFARAFFDENPLGQLGLLAMRDGVAVRLAPLSSSPDRAAAALRAPLAAGGDASLQNALDAAVAALAPTPPYGHREALFLLSTLSTADPGDIAASVRAAAAAGVRASVVGLAAEVHVFRALAAATGGTYAVALDAGHLRALVAAHAAPPPAPPGGAAASLVLMGFPARGPDAPGAAAFVGAAAELRPGGYACPRCAARAPALPFGCHVCGLTLVSSPHLARSYHHLFPVPPFGDVPPEELAAAGGGGAAAGGAGEADYGGDGGGAGAGAPRCYGCLLEVGPGRAGGGAASRCGGCGRLFCLECDIFVHEALHNCPGCEAAPAAAPGGDAMDVT